MTILRCSSDPFYPSLICTWFLKNFVELEVFNLIFQNSNETLMIFRPSNAIQCNKNSKVLYLQQWRDKSAKFEDSNHYCLKVRCVFSTCLTPLNSLWLPALILKFLRGQRIKFPRTVFLVLFVLPYKKAFFHFDPNWHEGGHFPARCPCWIRFCQLNFYQKLPNFLEVKININWVNLTPRQAHWVS